MRVCMTEPLLLYCMIITSSIVNITIIIIHIQSKKSCMLNGHWIINSQFRYTFNSSREALTMKYKLIFDILWECWHRKLYLNTSTNTVQINRNIISCVVAVVVGPALSGSTARVIISGLSPLLVSHRAVSYLHHHWHQWLVLASWEFVSNCKNFPHLVTETIIKNITCQQ